MQLQTYLKNIDISPKKIRFILPAVKKMSPSRAVQHLFYAKQKSARVLYKAIQSAIANAKQALKVSEDLLKFKVLTIEQGQKLKRFTAGSRGSAKPIVHRYSHIKIILETEEELGKPDDLKKFPVKIEERSEVKKETGKNLDKDSKSKTSDVKDVQKSKKQIKNQHITK